MRSAEYALLLIVVLVVAYLVVTPIAAETADRMNEMATLIERS